MHQKKDKISAKIKEWMKLFPKSSPCRCYFLFSHFSAAETTLTARATSGWFIYDVIPASSLMTSSPFYDLIGRVRCGLTALTFAKPYHLPGQEILMAAAHCLSLKTDSPPITKLEAPIAQNLQMPPIKLAALKCASAQTLSRVDLQVQTPCINPL